MFDGRARVCDVFHDAHLSVRTFHLNFEVHSHSVLLFVCFLLSGLGTTPTGAQLPAWCRGGGRIW